MSKIIRKLLGRSDKTADAPTAAPDADTAAGPAGEIAAAAKTPARRRRATAAPTVEAHADVTQASADAAAPAKPTSAARRAKAAAPADDAPATADIAPAAKPKAPARRAALTNDTPAPGDDVAPAKPRATARRVAAVDDAPAPASAVAPAKPRGTARRATATNDTPAPASDVVPTKPRATPRRTAAIDDTPAPADAVVPAKPRSTPRRAAAIDDARAPADAVAPAKPRGTARRAAATNDTPAPADAVAPARPRSTARRAAAIDDTPATADEVTPATPRNTPRRAAAVDDTPSDDVTPARPHATTRRAAAPAPAAAPSPAAAPAVVAPATASNDQSNASVDTTPAKPRQASRRAAKGSDTPAAPAAPVPASVPDTPVVIPASVHGINPALISRNAVRVTQGLQEAGFRAFIVGGAVRDLLLGVAPKDFDVATDATPDQVQRLFRRARIIGRRFQIVHVQFGQEIIEVSTFRALVDPAAEAATAAANAVQAAVDADGAERTAARLTTQAADIGANATATAYVNAPSDAHDGAPASDDTDDADDASTADGAADTRGAAPARADGVWPPRGERRDRGERGGRRRRREDPDRRLHAVDASGRVLRDNVWGEQHEDARRRDFTINAMYYDPATQTVLDYHQGMADMGARLLRMIGDPTARYREDPVRMLRVVRFAGKLDFEIEAATRAPIAGLAELINNVPAARVFDEILKLLLSGNALACLTRLRAEGLHRDLLPLLDVALEQSHSEKFITLSLTNTDARVRAGKTVSPGFLFAALLWHQTQQRWQRYVADGDYPIPALHRAMDEVLDAQTGKLAIQRRFVSDMKEIWGMQPRLEKRAGRSALKLLEHPRFRAAYDFLLLRCESGEMDPTLGTWWTDFISGDPGARETLLGGGPRDAKTKPRRRRRGGRGGGGGQGDHAGAAPAGAAPAAPRPDRTFEDD